MNEESVARASECSFFSREPVYGPSFPCASAFSNEITIIDFFQAPEQSSVGRDSFSVATSFKYREQGKEW